MSQDSDHQVRMLKVNHGQGDGHKACAGDCEEVNNKVLHANEISIESSALRKGKCVQLWKTRKNQVCAANQ